MGRSAWERLEGRVPVNAGAARLMKKLPDQENMAKSTTEIIAELEKENMELKQQIAMTEAELNMAMDVEIVLIGWVRNLLKATHPKLAIEALEKTEIPDYLLHLDIPGA